jgi:hypothetical protein
MASPRAKRIVFIVGLLFFVLFVVALVGAYMISRDPGFAFETPNKVEAENFAIKLGRYENAIATGHKGYSRFTQGEINSYIKRSVTNLANVTNTPEMHLRKFGIGLTATNLILYSWGEYRFLSMPLKFVAQRAYRIEQEGTNQWQMRLESFKVGELEVPKSCWDSVIGFVQPLDQPITDQFGSRTNIPALLVRKNELSERPELRLYTYKPIPPEDLR